MELIPFYGPRNPRTTPLWKLAETLYERLRREWEERFEARFGFWRGLADEAVARYLDCGIPEMGFARLRCDTCRRERLLTFSCRTRQLCPSCGAKRGAIFGAFLREEVARAGGTCAVGVNAMVANVSVRLSLAMELPVRPRSARANELIRESLNTIRRELRGDVRCQGK